MITKSQKLSILSIATLLGAGAAISACDTGPDTFLYDFLDAKGTVVGIDGVTPVKDLAIAAYDWVVTYTDGSTVAVAFDPKVTTDAAGMFGFKSADLDLESGNLAESCTDVCVEWSTGSEEYCSAYSYEDYCSSWEVDEEGYEYCASWSTEEYCSEWSTEYYDYCSGWAQDCTYYYPAREASDIKKAYADITYAVGPATWAVTSSQAINVAKTSLSVTDEQINEDRINETALWTQTDTFVTPFEVATPFSSKKQISSSRQQLVDAHNAQVGKRTAKASKSGHRWSKGRKHDAATKTVAELLTNPAQKAALAKARLGCKAVPKAAVGK